MKRRGRLLTTLIVFLALVFGLLAWVIVADIRPKLGLDLAGGTSVVLEATGEIKGPDVMDQVVDIVRARVDGLGVAEPEISRSGDRNIIVELPGLDDDQRAREIIGQTAKLGFRQVQQPPQSGGAGQQASTPGNFTLDPTTGQLIDPSTGQPVDPSKLGGTSGTPPPASPPASGTNQQSLGRPDAEGVSGRPATAVDPSDAEFHFRDGVLAQTTSAPVDTAPPATDTAPTSEAPTTTAPAQQTPCEQAKAAGLLTPKDKMQADQPVVLCDKEGQQVYFLGPVRVKGEEVDDATAQVRQDNNQWVVQLDFSDQGEADYKQLSSDAACARDKGNQYGTRIAIVLDDQVVSAPAVAAEVKCGEGISGGGVITMGASGKDAEKDAKDLALVLRYGALPVELRQANIEKISPTLGTDSLKAGLVGAAIGMVLVAFFVVMLYRVYGLIIVAQLGIFGICVYLFLCLMGHFYGMTTSLSGLAAVAISIGINADSAIVYIERVKDELREGRTTRTAFDRGFKRAWKTIIAGDTVSALAAIVLYILAVGSVRGFALMLGVSVIFDIVISWFFTRPLSLLLAGGGAFSHERALFWRRPSGTPAAGAAA